MSANNASAWHAIPEYEFAECCNDIGAILEMLSKSNVFKTREQAERYVLEHAGEDAMLDIDICEEWYIVPLALPDFSKFLRTVTATRRVEFAD